LSISIAVAAASAWVDLGLSNMQRR
jgi:hypothetical protein